MVFVLIAVLTFVLQYFLHWEVWVVALVSYVISALLGKTAWGVFFSAFFSVFLVWSGMAFWQDIQNDQILSMRVAQLLGVSAASEWFFIITGLLGALLASVAGLAGYYLKRIFIKSKLKTPISAK
ncbi:MAG: hypothetical protein SFU27_06045 [Thermonemataceae bacterium]|nr:hypothetical protein [Thermonemataceae bacterium]